MYVVCLTKLIKNWFNKIIRNKIGLNSIFALKLAS